MLLLNSNYLFVAIFLSARLVRVRVVTQMWSRGATHSALWSFLPEDASGNTYVSMFVRASCFGDGGGRSRKDGRHWLGLCRLPL